MLMQTSPSGLQERYHARSANFPRTCPVCNILNVRVPDFRHEFHLSKTINLCYHLRVKRPKAGNANLGRVQRVVLREAQPGPEETAFVEGIWKEDHARLEH